MPSDSSGPTLPLPRRAGAYTFAAIFAVESFARALNSTVVSLQAYDILGTSQRVSVLSTSMSLIVLVTTLLLPQALGRLRRRWAYTFGALLLLLASFALGAHVLEGQAAGMWLRNTGAAVMNITLSLYIMDHIRRTELASAGRLRMPVPRQSRIRPESRGRAVARCESVRCTPVPASLPTAQPRRSPPGP